ncbi:MAG TPA: CAP domain-containing protein [Nocardioidaceae bacterium]|nr:CAP domain-containing protein [Nocardioidaceae bacterium]
MRRVVIALAAAVCLVAPVVPSAESAPSVGPDALDIAGSKPRSTHTDRERHYQRRVFHWTNVARRNHGLPAFHRIPCLRRIAVRWSEHLAASGDFEHQNLGIIFRRCDRSSSAGENIARGGISPRQMVRFWMRSPDHRANILNRDFTHLGVGTARRNGRWTGVQDFAGFS